jgi:excisionase family DNA binding protein
MSEAPARPVNWRVSDFCRAHGIGRTKLYELISAGEIRTVKLGRATLIPDAEARRWQTRLLAQLEGAE